MSEKQQFQNAWDKESATTLKLLKAYPQDKTDLKPHPTSRSAKDLAVRASDGLPMRDVGDVHARSDHIGKMGARLLERPTNIP